MVGLDIFKLKLPSIKNILHLNIQIYQPELRCHLSTDKAIRKFFLEKFCYRKAHENHLRFLQSLTKYLKQSIDFMYNSGVTVKVQYKIFRNFSLVFTNISFLEDDWAIDYNSMNFCNSFDFS